MRLACVKFIDIVSPAIATTESSPQKLRQEGPAVSSTGTRPKRLQPMLATLTDAPFDDSGWVFKDKYDGFRMVAKIESGKVTLYCRNGKIISHSYIESPGRSKE